MDSVDLVHMLDLSKLAKEQTPKFQIPNQIITEQRDESWA